MTTVLWHGGVTRTVILTRHWAIKIPSLVYGWKFFLYGFLANMQEMAWSGFDERLCPIRFSLPWGLLVAMPRCAELSDDEYLEYVSEDWASMDDKSALPVEMKSNSFGWLNGKIVAFDYGGCGRDGRTTQAVPERAN